MTAGVEIRMRVNQSNRNKKYIIWQLELVFL